MEFFEFFSGFSGIAGYVIVVATLLACGLGVPVPEDIILISGGYIAFEAGHGMWPMVIVGLFGILAGDSMIYGFGRKFGLQLAGHRFLQRYVTQERLEKVNGLFQKHGEKILIAARFMPGVRAVAFFSAGAMKVPYWKFLLYDGLAALVSAPLWVILGYKFGHDVVDWAKQFQSFLIAGALVAVLAFIIWRNLAARAAARKAAPPLALEALPPVVAPEAAPKKKSSIGLVAIILVGLTGMGTAFAAGHRASTHAPVAHATRAP